MTPEYFQEMEKAEESPDKQYILYCLKVLDGVYYITDEYRFSVSGRLVTRVTLLDVVLGLPEFKDFSEAAKLDEFSFWDVYYRHNNYLIEKNGSLIDQMFQRKTNNTFCNIFEELKKTEQSYSRQFIKSGVLTKDGVRACSLVNMVKTMTSLGIGVGEINKLVKQLQIKYRLDRESIERSVQCAEEFVSVYLDPPRLPRSDLVPVFKQAALFLEERDILELSLVSKQARIAIGRDGVYQRLRLRDDFVRNCGERMDLWSRLVPKVVFHYFRK